MIESKRCRICGAVRPMEDFHRAAGMKDGHRNECRSCAKAIRRAHCEDNRDRYIASARRWQLENPARTRATRRLRNQHPDRKRALRDGYYRRTYGISADDVDAMLEAQGGGCAICGVLPERLASPHVDHDHEHGHLRGLLCLACNQGLGQFRDDPDVLTAAVAYLRRTRRPSLSRSVASLAAV